MAELDAGGLSGSISMDDWDLGGDDSSDDQTQESADDSGSSGAYDRYGTGAYDGNVGSGTVSAANQGGQAQSAQLEEVEEVSSGNIDSHDVTVNDDGSASFGITGGVVDEVQADADGNVIDPTGFNLPSVAGIDISGQMLAIGAVLIGALAFLFGGN